MAETAPPAAGRSAGDRAAAHDGPVLETRGLTRSFGSLRACDNVSLTLEAGQIHALIGPNGAGKSTLVKLIAGQIAPDSGSVFLMGRPLDGLSPALRARAGLGRSFQVSSVAAAFTCLQNVCLSVMGRSGRIFSFLRPALGQQALVEPAMAALERVGLAHRALAPAEALSHGERRRLEIAMALALAPRALLLDEPMAGMGHEGAAEVSALLLQVKSEAPILLVEHDMDAVFRLADRITVMAEGRVLARGSPAEIRADRAVRATYLGEAT